MSVCWREATDEVGFEGLNGFFRHIDTMIWWIDKLLFASFFLDECLEWWRNLIVSHIEHWCVLSICLSICWTLLQTLWWCYCLWSLCMVLQIWCLCHSHKYATNYSFMPSSEVTGKLLSYLYRIFLPLHPRRCTTEHISHTVWVVCDVWFGLIQWRRGWGIWLDFFQAE